MAYLIDNNCYAYFKNDTSVFYNKIIKYKYLSVDDMYIWEWLTQWSATAPKPLFAECDFL